MIRVRVIADAEDPGVAEALRAYPGEPVEAQVLPSGIQVSATVAAPFDVILGPLGDLSALEVPFAPPGSAIPADLFPCLRADANSSEDSLLPLRLDPRLLYYRTDMVEERRERQAFAARMGRELTVPASWGQFASAARFFTRPPQLYGCVFAGTPGGLVSVFTEVVYSLGGRVSDPRGVPLLRSRQAEAAVALLYDLHVRWQVTPRDLPEMDESAADEFFRRGSAALTISGPRGFRRTRDTSFSAVAGWLGLAALPGAPAPKRATCPTILAAGIDSGAPCQSAAVHLFEYLLGDLGQGLLCSEAGAPARQSVWEREEARLLEGTLAERRWRLFREAIESAPRPLPRICAAAWTESLGVALRRMLLGDLDPAATLLSARAALDGWPG